MESFQRLTQVTDLKQKCGGWEGESVSIIIIFCFKPFSYWLMKNAYFVNLWCCLELYLILIDLNVFIYNSVVELRIITVKIPTTVMT